MNKKTIIIICSSVIGLIVVILLALWLVSILRPKYFDYNEVEEKIKKATEKYYKANVDLLPDTDGTYNLSYTTLVEGEYIRPLNELLKDGDSCTIQISVLKSDVNYSYIPYLNCGENYITKELYKQIIDDNELATEESGLYQDPSGEYYFKGKINNNYVAFGAITEKKETTDILWKIVSIKDNKIKLKKVEKVEDDTVWDNRYNAVTEKTSGYNTFDDSVIRDNLLKLENENAFLSEEELLKMEATNLCIGTRSKTDTTKDGSVECSVLSKDKFYFGTITPYEYMRASLDENCDSAKNRSCSNFNFLSDKTHEEEWIVTADTETNYMTYYFNGSIFVLDSAKYRKELYPTIILNEYTFYDSGIGSKTDPYRIK